MPIGTRVLLLIENGPQSAKEWLFDRVLATARGAGVTVRFLRHTRVPASINRWYEGRISADQVLETDLTLPAAARDDVRQRWPDDHIVGVYTYLEEAVPITNALAHFFGCLPITQDPLAVALRRKDTMRERLRGWPAIVQPEHTTCPNDEAVQAELRRLRDGGVEECIVKPVEMGSSYGVARIATTWDDDTASKVERARTVDFPAEVLRQQYGFSSDVLIERFVARDAPLGEISVDGLVCDGTLRIAAITEKHVAADSDRAFAELGHSTNLVVCDALRIELEQAVASLAAGLRLAATAFHAEFLLSAGRPVFVEVGARLGGDLIPRLIELATGVDLVRASVEAALGLDPHQSLNVRRDHGASIVFFSADPPLMPQHVPVMMMETVRYEKGGHIIFTSNDQRTCASAVRSLLAR